MSKKDKSIEKLNSKGKIRKEFYEIELEKLQSELVKMQYWVKQEGLRVIILFEGRDAAGKGGIIKRIIEPLNPRGARIAALDKPTEKERKQWYYQRYVAHLPSAGEIVIFDRSWYTRAGVEKVMGFCSEKEYEEFLRSCPLFEEMLIRDGIILLKYWVSVSDEVQEERFRDRATDPAKRWKLSPIDLASWDKWIEYSMAKDEMMKLTDSKMSPWYDVEADDKLESRLNCISHILGKIPYHDVSPQLIELPPRKIAKGYLRMPMTDINFIPDKY